MSRILEVTFPLSYKGWTRTWPLFPVTGALGSSALYTSLAGVDDRTGDVPSAISICLCTEAVSWEHRASVGVLPMTSEMLLISRQVASL